MLPAMGIYRFTSHSSTPTTIKPNRICMRGMFFYLSFLAPRHRFAGVDDPSLCIGPACFRADVERSGTWDFRAAQAKAWLCVLASVFLLPHGQNGRRPGR